MTETTQRTGSCPVWIKVALAVSLVANMAIAGLYLGLMSQEKERKRGSERQIAWIVRFVPEARRDEAEKLFEGKRDDIRTLYRDRPKYMGEIVEAIRAEPFAPETLIAAMRAHRDNSDQRRQIVEETTVNLLVNFTTEERAYFANRMEESLQRWNARRGRN